eukprot:1232405-Prymnesium_polylepis.1
MNCERTAALSLLALGEHLGNLMVRGRAPHHRIDAGGDGTRLHARARDPQLATALRRRAHRIAPGRRACAIVSGRRRRRLCMVAQRRRRGV